MVAADAIELTVTRISVAHTPIEPIVFVCACAPPVPESNRARNQRHKSRDSAHLILQTPVDRRDTIRSTGGRTRRANNPCCLADCSRGLLVPSTVETPESDHRTTG